MSEVIALVLAAGKGQRFGSDKIFVTLQKKPLLAWSVDVFNSCSRIDGIVIVGNASNLERIEGLAKKRAWDKLYSICEGGVRRQDSVLNGLKAIVDCEWVIIHDAARPFISEDIILSGLTAARESGASIAAVPVKDTVKIAGPDGYILSTPPRDDLWIAQTPQIFRFDIISKAFELIDSDVTDDAMVVEKAGYHVKLFMGSYQNIKVTTKEDLYLARLIAREIGK